MAYPDREYSEDIFVREVEFGALVGAHELTGVELWALSSRYDADDRFEDAESISFVLDGKIYTGIEDPNDGYRSSMERLFESKNIEMENTFAPVAVVGMIREKDEHGDASDILELVDAKTGKVVLAVGTGNTDDYYPYFVATFNPKNMAVNQQ